MRSRPALYTALTVSVDCPHCGESLPSSTGSLFWTISELGEAILKGSAAICNGCDEPFLLMQQNKASLFEDA